MDIKNAIIQLADQKLTELSKFGFINGGHNGPYYDNETPVRNSAHWITTFRYCYTLTKDERYKEAVLQCAAFLQSDSARPMSKAFHCRSNPNKDFSNGTIGQAWAIEGLVCAYELLKDKSLLDLAEEVFLLHPFDSQRKVWRIVNVDGSYKQYDPTYNHQLWFAAAGFMILKHRKSDKIKQQCEAFINAQDQLLRIYSNGLIKHPLLFLDTFGKSLSTH